MKHIGFLIAICLAGCQEKQPEDTAQKADRMSDNIPGKTITIDQLESMFDNITDQTDWDLKNEMLWGYFFTHHEPTALEPLRDKLVVDGYRFVDLYQSDEVDQDDSALWWLHVEREEIHTPKTLDQRNDSFYILAAQHGVDSYDGMDIGPIINAGKQNTTQNQ